MRGITNITPRTTPKVNGSVGLYEVSGQTIQTGDFVEFSNEEKYGYFRSLYYKKSLVFEDGLFVVVGSSSVILFKTENGEITSLGEEQVEMNHSYSYGLAKIGNSFFVSSPTKLYNFKIVNETLVLKETLNFDSSDNENLCTADENGNLIVVKKSEMSVYILSNDLLSLSANYSYSDGVTKYKIHDVSIVDGNLIIAFVARQYSYNTFYALNYEIVYSSNSVSSLTYKNNLQLSYTTSGIINVKVIGIKNNLFCIRYRQGSDYNKISVLSFDSNGIILLNTTNIDPFRIESFNEISEDYFIVPDAYTKNMKVYKLNELNYEIILDETYTSFLKLDSEGVSNNDIDIVLSGNIIHINDSAYHFFGFNDGVLTKGWSDQTKVKKYAGGKAIGFAKVGGAVGQTIRVHSPSQGGA